MTRMEVMTTELSIRVVRIGDRPMTIALLNQLPLRYAEWALLEARPAGVVGWINRCPSGCKWAKPRKNLRGEWIDNDGEEAPHEHRHVLAAEGENPILWAQAVDGGQERKASQCRSAAANSESGAKLWAKDPSAWARDKVARCEQEAAQWRNREVACRALATSWREWFESLPQIYVTG